jgi:hypothetical protein
MIAPGHAYRHVHKEKSSDIETGNKWLAPSRMAHVLLNATGAWKGSIFAGTTSLHAWIIETDFN